MRFWDSSAIVPLIVAETQTLACCALLAADPEVVAWALTPVELLSAIHRKRRESKLDTAAVEGAQQRLDALREAWTEVTHLELVRGRAERLLGVHRMRAADSLQLAAALVACEERPSSLTFVSLDGDLSDAARREGFRVLPEP